MQQIRLIDPVETGRQGGIKRARRLSPERRREISSTAAKARWHRPQYETAKQLADMMVAFAQQRLREGGIASQL